jgi:hypothetical protein
MFKRVTIEKSFRNALVILTLSELAATAALRRRSGKHSVLPGDQELLLQSDHQLSGNQFDASSECIYAGG